MCYINCLVHRWKMSGVVCRCSLRDYICRYMNTCTVQYIHTLPACMYVTFFILCIVHMYVCMYVCMDDNYVMYIRSTYIPTYYILCPRNLELHGSTEPEHAASRHPIIFFSFFFFFGPRAHQHTTKLKIQTRNNAAGCSSFAGLQ